MINFQSRINIFYFSTMIVNGKIYKNVLLTFIFNTRWNIQKRFRCPRCICDCFYYLIRISQTLCRKSIFIQKTGEHRITSDKKLLIFSTSDSGLRFNSTRLQLREWQLIQELIQLLDGGLACAWAAGWRAIQRESLDSYDTRIYIHVYT